MHRDVKPANVMITKTGAVKVMDFGIARAVADGQAAVTQTAAVIGTAQYLSPEQARGEAVDARSDVYAAGCVLFELLTGEPPFTGDSPVAVAYQHVREDPKPPSALNGRVTPALDAIVLKAMSKGAPNRYQSAAEMRTDLVRVLSNQRPLAPMVMTDDERTTIMSQGRTPEPGRGRHRPAALSNDYDDYDPYEDEEEERRRKRKKNWIIALVAVLALALIGFIAWLVTTVFDSEPVSDEVVVPNVIDRIADDAQRELTDQGFEVDLQPVPCQSSPDGQPGKCGPDSIGKVIDSNPKPGEKMKKSDRLTLLVGAPAQKVNVPDVSGRSVDEAKKLLKDAGLAVAPEQGEREVEDGEDVGDVVETDPTAGQPVSKGSQVKLIVGKEPEKVDVPDFTGQNVDAARTNLENLGFKVEVNEVDSDQDKGTVVDQDPKNTEAPPGSTVRLDVSKGQDENTFTMPNIIGQSLQEAEGQLREMGWTGNFNAQQGETNDPNELGKIVDAEFGEGQQVKKDQNIGVTVATQLNPGGGNGGG